MNKMIKAPFENYIIKFIEGWQKDKSVHPLTCGKCGESLCVDENGLFCPIGICDYIQDWVPDAILTNRTALDVLERRVSPDKEND